MAVRAPSGALVAVVLFAEIAMAAAAARAAGPTSSDSYPVATAVRLGGDETDTRFVMDLSRKIDLHAFTLADPYRVVVDIPEVIFQLPPKAGATGRGLVKEFRFGLMMVGGSRIVLDVKQPVRVEKAFVVDAAAGDPARLVLDLVPTDRKSFLQQIAIEDRLLTAQPAPQPEPQAQAQAQLQPQPQPQPQPQVQSSDPRPLVVLDPGHGGIDTGTVAPTGQEEKNIVLDFAKRLRDRILKYGKYRVLMTRTDDTFIPLDERVRIARNAHAALFISIHADSLPRHESNAQGATVYTLSNKASDAQAAEVAKKENGSDIIAGVNLKSEPNDVADILVDLAKRETKTFSTQFARNLVGDMKGVARLHKEPIKSAGFRVLQDPDVPSVLIELGYVSNPADLRSLMSDAWRDRTADSIAKAVDNYLSTHVASRHASGD